ncbi:MAG TPA: AMP-binding protein [Methylomirabilota bacterium]|nr:AMP-binding protein [Methylomirabilota bacterium]
MLRISPGEGFVPFERAAIEQSIPRRFAQQVEAGPDRLAVGFRSASLTYAELDRRANRVARAILARGIRAEPVAVVVDQGLSLLPAILGILKTGRIYVPLEAGLGRERLRHMLRDSCASTAFVTASAGPLVRDVAGRDLDLLDIDDLPPGLSSEAPEIEIAATAPAYIYYTTGSTGEPKGVVDSHRNVLHNVMRYTNGLGIGPNDRLTLLQSPSFSGAVSSMFCALLNGATSLPFDVREASSGELAEYVDHEGVTIYHSVPTIFRSFLRGDRVFPGVRVVRLEGDRAARLDVELFRRHFASGCVLANGLGATETGIVRRFLLGRETPFDGEIVPIGYPIEDMEVAVLGDDGKPAAPGEVGEISVRSEYLALGYWNRPDLTARAFETDARGQRAYRTGDLGRLRADGCLEHLGRRDSRTKIRGVTVSLAEVEAALAGLPCIREAAVIACTDAHQERRLLAYYVPAAGSEPTVSELRRRLAERLPPQMIPSRYGRLDALPLNQNLKVDRNALPAPTRARPTLDQAYAPPEDPTQCELVRIWQDLLEVEPIGIRDDFFDLGGDSLLATGMLAAIQEAIGVEASPSVLLSGSTVEHVAASLARPAKAAAKIAPVQTGGSKAPLYFLHGDYLGGGLYCRKIARALGPEQPVFALTPCGLDGEAAPPTIEEMAVRHLRALRRHQAHGPYRLAGNCNGGLIALEMARRLAEEGETVEPLLVVRTSAQNARFSRARRLIERGGRLLGLRGATQRALVRRWRWFVRAWSTAPASGRVRLVAAKLLRLVRRSEPEAGWQEPVPAAAPDDRDALIATFTDAADDYVPLPYRGKVVLYWPAEEPESAADALRWWRRISPHAEVETIPGDHLTSLTVHGQTFGRRLAERLGAA